MFNSKSKIYIMFFKIFLNMPIQKKYVSTIPHFNTIIPNTKAAKVNESADQSLLKA